jgi:hypothetical protein
MQFVKIGLGAGLLFLGFVIGSWMLRQTPLADASPTVADLTSPPPCNSPQFLQKLQGLAEKTRAEELSEGAITADMALHIQSTTTLGQMGNFNSCSMVYDHGRPDNNATYNYLIGRNDAGDIIWRSSDQPPFEFIPLVMMPGEHQYP